MILNWRVASAGVNWSWMVRGAINSPSSTVLVFRRNWTWIAACEKIHNDISEICFLVHSLYEFIMHATMNLSAYTYNYPHSPSLSRMLTVAESRPGTNEAGAVALPEMTKLSVPSTRKSSVISTTRLWTLLLLVPWHNVNLWKTRRKSSFSASRLKNVTVKLCQVGGALTGILIHFLGIWQWAYTLDIILKEVEIYN